MAYKCFHSYLERNTSISKSRIPLLAEGVAALHRALSYMDMNNLKIVRDIGLYALLREYSRVEQLTKVPSDVLERTQKSL